MVARGKGVAVDFEIETSKSRREVNMLSKKLQDSREEIRKLTAQVNRMGRDLEKANKRAEEGTKANTTATTDWARRVRDLAAGYVGLSGGISAVKAIHARMIQEAEQGIQRLQQSIDPLRGIRQISGSTAEFQKNREQIRAIAVREGRTEAEVARLFFSAASAGAIDQLPAIVEGSRFLTDAEGAATAVGTFRSAQSFGEAEAGTGRQILSKLGRAGASSKFTVEDLISGSILAAGPAKATGSTDEELLALLSSTSFSFTNIERAATALNAVQNTLASGITVGEGDQARQVRFDQAGTVAGFQQLRTQFPEQFQQLVDSNVRFAEGARAIGGALDSGAFAKTLADVQAENESLAFLRTQANIFAQDAETQSAVAVSGSQEAAAQAQAERAAGAATEREIRAQRAIAGLRKTDRLSDFSVAGLGLAIQAGSDIFGATPEQTAGFIGGAFGGGRGAVALQEVVTEAIQVQAQEARKQTALLERMADRAESQVGLASDNGPGNR